MNQPLLILFALDMEAEGVVSRLEDPDESQHGSLRLTHGRLAGVEVVVASSGVGRALAHQATLELVSHLQPSWVISAGFAGGVVSHVHRGDIVLANSVTDEAQNILAIDLNMSEAGTPPGLHVGRLVTVNDVKERPQEKQALAASHKAIAVDMESFASANVCAQKEIRFMVVRVITDEVDEQLPPEVRHLLAQDSTAGLWGAVAGAAIGRPSSLKDLWTLRKNAVTASERLGQFLSSMFQQLR